MRNAGLPGPERDVRIAAAATVGLSPLGVSGLNVRQIIGACGQHGGDNAFSHTNEGGWWRRYHNSGIHRIRGPTLNRLQPAIPNVRLKPFTPSHAAPPSRLGSGPGQGQLSCGGPPCAVAAERFPPWALWRGAGAARPMRPSSPPSLCDAMPVATQRRRLHHVAERCIVLRNPAELAYGAKALIRSCSSRSSTWRAASPGSNQARTRWRCSRQCDFTSQTRNGNTTTAHPSA